MRNVPGVSRRGAGQPETAGGSAVELGREDDRRRGAIDAGDAADVIEDAVDFFCALGGHHRDQVERPAHGMQRADTSDSAQRLLHMITPLGIDGDGDMGGDAPPGRRRPEPGGVTGDHTVALEPADSVLHCRASHV